MQVMKAVAAVTLLLALLITPVGADQVSPSRFMGDQPNPAAGQGAPTREVRPFMKHLEKIAERIGLNESQKTQIQGYMQNLRERVKEINSRYDEKFKTILTPNQLQEWEKMKGEASQFKEKIKGRIQKRIAQFKKELNLTPEQESKFKQLREQHRKETEPLRKELAKKNREFWEKALSILTPEQKQKVEAMKQGVSKKIQGAATKLQDAGSRIALRRASERLSLTADQEQQARQLMEARKQEIRSLFESYRDKIMRVLTPEQEQKLKEIRGFKGQRPGERFREGKGEGVSK